MLTETVHCKIIWKDLTGCNFCYSAWRKEKSVTRFTTQSLISGNYLLTWHCKCTQSYKMLTKIHVYSLKNLGPWLVIWKVYLPLQVQQKPQEMMSVPCDISKLWAPLPNHSLQSLWSHSGRINLVFLKKISGRQLCIYLAGVLYRLQCCSRQGLTAQLCSNLQQHIKYFNIVWTI